METYLKDAIENGKMHRSTHGGRKFGKSKYQYFCNLNNFMNDPLARNPKCACIILRAGHTQLMILESKSNFLKTFFGLRAGCTQLLILGM